MKWKALASCFSFKNKKKMKTIFPAVTTKVVLSTKKRPRRDFYHCSTHIGLHSCCWCQTDKKKKISPRTRVGRLIKDTWEYIDESLWVEDIKSSDPAAAEVLTPPTQISFLAVNLHSFQADMCSSKSNSNISRAWRHTTVLQTAIKPLASALWCALHFTTPILCVETGTCAHQEIQIESLATYLPSFSSPARGPQTQDGLMSVSTLQSVLTSAFYEMLWTNLVN